MLASGCEQHKPPALQTNFISSAIDARWLRRAILICSLLGSLLFGTALLASFVDPLLVERVGHEMIRLQVQKKVGEHIDAIDQGFVVRQAARYTKGYAAQIEFTRKLLRDKAPERIAALIAEMQRKDCECRRTIETRLRGILENSLASAERALQGLDTLIRSQYLVLAERITREFRIFTGVNAVVCAALAAAALSRPRAGVHLLPAALVLLAAALITGGFYLFAQNWLATLIFGSYVGWAYVGYLGAVAILLTDIVFNRGRVTGRVLGSMLDISGAGGIILPC
ncbi:MAG: hypothetical protein JWN73_1402 [Betaproteobacteria bacterium]|nr:hypothetical protein [Betaproteobacteria bacterium]